MQLFEYWPLSTDSNCVYQYAIQCAFLLHVRSEVRKDGPLNEIRTLTATSQAEIVQSMIFVPAEISL